MPRLFRKTLYYQNNFLYIFTRSYFCVLEEACLLNEKHLKLWLSESYPCCYIVFLDWKLCSTLAFFSHVYKLSVHASYGATKNWFKVLLDVPLPSVKYKKTCGDCSLNLNTMERKEKKQENSSDISIGNSVICSDIWHKYVLKIIVLPNGSWNLRQFWNIIEWYLCQISHYTNHPIICLYYFPQRFVIFKCGYFKLRWNTAALSQSKFRNFSCSSINSLMPLYFTVVWWFCSTQEKISRVLFSILQGKGICYS